MDDWKVTQGAIIYNTKHLSGVVDSFELGINLNLRFCTKGLVEVMLETLKQ